MLLDFIGPHYSRLIDLCAGVGVIGLGLLKREPHSHALLVEIQERLATLARRNADDNGLGARVVVRQAEIGRDGLGDLGAAYDLVVANPPYHALEDGPPSPDPEVAIAQHELKLKLPALTAVMRRALEPGGRAALIYPAARVAALLTSLESQRLRPLRLRFVHPRVGEPAVRVLVEAKKGARGSLLVEGPLILRDQAGQYTPDARRALGEK